MTPSGASQNACTIAINVFDGTRQPIPSTVDVLFTFIDGNQKIVSRNYVKASSINIEVPYCGNFGGPHSVIAYADGYEQAGYFPVKAAPNTPQQADLMLLGKNAAFKLSDLLVASLQPTLEFQQPVSLGQDAFQLTISAEAGVSFRVITPSPGCTTLFAPDEYGDNIEIPAGASGSHSRCTN